jgi:hypothetical protein
MSSDPLARSDIWDGAPSETEYDALYAAVTSTARGRWFLAEYANRNRQADTLALVEAIARIEAAMRVKASASLDLSKALECIHDIAFALRERGADPNLCDALDAAARQLAPGRAAGNGTESRAPSAADLLNAADDFTAAAGRRTLRPVPAPDSSHAGLKLELEEPAGHRPRWYIEPPDFAFPNKPRHAEAVHLDSAMNSEETRALLPEARLLPGPGDDPADLFEPPTINGASAAAAAAPIPAASLPRAAPPDPFAGSRALSAEEVIALFS